MAEEFIDPLSAGLADHYLSLCESAFLKKKKLPQVGIFLIN